MKKLPLISRGLLAIIGTLALVQCAQTAMSLAEIYPVKKPAAFAFAGKAFEGIDALMNGAGYAGYYTDRGPDDSRFTLELLQAQYVLSPLVLDTGNVSHRYVIVNCQDTPAAIAKFKALGARPLTRNIGGIFLVERPGLAP